MSNSPHSHHAIDYIEFTVADMDQAKGFYEAAFGWAFNDYGPGYAGIQKEQGGEAGGLRLEPETTAGGPLVILYSTDLEASLANVQAATLFGKIGEPRQFGEEFGGVGDQGLIGGP